ncbi:hypothetical protein J14TS2_15160 [Bacillus sp. J14TS2]|uniref:hypothetical protein n=1 Tax=unclassified Bacillus (in: firmicutes) TaxID=185979 RepID=UPI001A978612|nr:MULTISPECIES: hypothetical protein [unclassified Bacillus (in: firmicutes)]MBO0994048.1 hypothetical protein [Bacillus sp. SD088]GIN71041.1 hypothetical protein J14TS2_15160 [Bacillus sp. J14TS2]
MRANEKNQTLIYSSSQIIQMDLQDKCEKNNMDLLHESIHEAGLTLSEIKAWKKSLYRS